MIGTSRCKRTQGSTIALFLISCTALAVMIYAQIGFDVLAIAVMLGSCWCMGCLFPSLGEGWCKELLRIALGMAVIGFTLCGLLLLGWGGKTQYLLVLSIPPAIWYLRGGRLSRPSFPADHSTQICIVLLAALALFLFVYASAPVSKYDALTGHLPITMYAARNGCFNTNIAESITYTQTGIFSYGFFTVFASFGAYKAMTMWNVALYLLIFAVLAQFSKKLYINASPVVLAILLFSVPMFFEFSTVMYVEMMPIFLAFSGFLAFAELKPEQGWFSLPYLGLLFGCAVISKLTISYTVLFGGLVAITLFFIYAVKNRVPLGRAAGRFLLSGTVFFAILAVPFGFAWYHYGNPVFPMFNGLFQSPYFPLENFVDPFSGSKLSLSIPSILTMVFHTGNNIEMHNGGLGVFLLLLPLIPISWLVYRKRPLLVWGVSLLISYGVSTLFTYNLRYYMAVFMLAVLLLAVALNILLDRLPKGGRLTAMLLAMAIALPGIAYIEKCYPWQTSLTTISDEISTSVFSNLLKEIPDGKRVFASEPFKGDYNGYLAPNNWHGAAWQSLIALEGISKEAYISSFDYYLCNTADPVEQALLQSCQSSEGVEFVLLDGEGNYQLYQITQSGNSELLLDETFDQPCDVMLESPHTVAFSVGKWCDYQITQEMENATTSTVDVRFQINWMDVNGGFVDTSIAVYPLEAGQRCTSVSDVITPPSGAVTGILYLGPHATDTHLTAYSYQLSQFSKEEYAAQIDELMRNRSYLIQGGNL